MFLLRLDSGGGLSKKFAPAAVRPVAGSRLAVAGLALGWVCYCIASNLLTYMHAAAEDRR